MIFSELIEELIDVFTANQAVFLFSFDFAYPPTTVPCNKNTDRMPSLPRSSDIPQPTAVRMVKSA